jgi:hypothetical protein
MADVDARVDRASSPPSSLLNSSIHYAASLARAFRSAATAIPPSASAVAEGGELLGEAAAEGRHECEEP